MKISVLSAFLGTVLFLGSLGLMVCARNYDYDHDCDEELYQPRRTTALRPGYLKRVGPNHYQFLDSGNDFNLSNLDIKNLNVPSLIITPLEWLLNWLKDKLRSDHTTKRPSNDDLYPNNGTSTESPESTDPQSADSRIQRACIDAHNRYRVKHGAKPLVESSKLVKFAEIRAREIIKNFGHRPKSEYGENLAMRSSQNAPCEALVELWYDEIRYYDFDAGKFSLQTGHFTQLVWKNSKYIGCGYISQASGTYLACEYDPPGNYEDQFLENVQNIV